MDPTKEARKKTRQKYNRWARSAGLTFQCKGCPALLSEFNDTGCGYCLTCTNNAGRVVALLIALAAGVELWWFDQQFLERWIKRYA